MDNIHAGWGRIREENWALALYPLKQTEDQSQEASSGRKHPVIPSLDSFYDTETAVTPSDQRLCIHHAGGKHNHFSLCEGDVSGDVQDRISVSQEILGYALHQHEETEDQSGEYVLQRRPLPQSLLCFAPSPFYNTSSTKAPPAKVAKQGRSKCRLSGRPLFIRLLKLARQSTLQ
jgi:hypothetical protein